jgi:hypothetical protein
MQNMANLVGTDFRLVREGKEYTSMMRPPEGEDEDGMK